MFKMLANHNTLMEIAASPLLLNTALMMNSNMITPFPPSMMAGYIYPISMVVSEAPISRSRSFAKKIPAQENNRETTIPVKIACTAATDASSGRFSPILLETSAVVPTLSPIPTV